MVESDDVGVIGVRVVVVEVELLTSIAGRASSSLRLVGKVRAWPTIKNDDDGGMLPEEMMIGWASIGIVVADDIGVVRGTNGGVEGSCVNNVVEVELLLLSSIGGRATSTSRVTVGKVRGSKRSAHGGVEGANGGVEGSCVVVVVVEVELLSSIAGRATSASTVIVGKVRGSSSAEADDVGVVMGANGGVESVGVADAETELLSSIGERATSSSSRVVGIVRGGMLVEAEDVGVIGVCVVVVEVELLTSVICQEELRLRLLQLGL